MAHQPPVPEDMTRDQLVRQLTESRAVLAAAEQRSAQLAEQLRQAKDELARSNRELQEFVSVASHDLQEPLRAITGFMQLLKNRYSDRLDDKGRDFIERAKGAGQRMQTQISELLRLSRISTGGAEFARADLGEIVSEVLERLNPRLRQPACRIDCGRLPELPVDRNQIGSLFKNLISNGLTYNTSAEPSLEIGARRQDGQYLFWVKDNGIGIAPEFHQRIFVVFQRLHSEREYAGNGTGLTFCKKIVERHGGELWVESEPQQGACFYFTLPEGGSADFPR